MINSTRIDFIAKRTSVVRQSRDKSSSDIAIQETQQDAQLRDLLSSNFFFTLITSLEKRIAQTERKRDDLKKQTRLRTLNEKITILIRDEILMFETRDNFVARSVLFDDDDATSLLSSNENKESRDVKCTHEETHIVKSYEIKLKNLDKYQRKFIREFIN